nr:zinc finger, CCHC-type [Tanacetum cinerariifolium]
MGLHGMPICILTYLRWGSRGVTLVWTIARGGRHLNNDGVHWAGNFIFQGLVSLLSWLAYSQNGLNSKKWSSVVTPVSWYGIRRVGFRLQPWRREVGLRLQPWRLFDIVPTLLDLSLKCATNELQNLTISRQQARIEWEVLRLLHFKMAAAVQNTNNTTISMSPEIQRALKNYKAYDMIQELKTMFEKQAKQELFETVKVFHACKQEDGQSVSSYLLKMKSNLEILKRLGYAMPNELGGLKGSRKLKHGALSLYVSNGMRADVEALGSFDLVLPSSLIIVLDNCHFAHTITSGVVSISRLVNNGYIHTFMSYGISVSKDIMFYFNVIPRDGIFEIDMHNRYPNDSSMFNVSNKRAKHVLDSSYLWHCHLGHINKKRMDKLQRDGILQPTYDESLGKCKSCISGIWRARLFHIKWKDPKIY